LKLFLEEHRVKAHFGQYFFGVLQHGGHIYDTNVPAFLVGNESKPSPNLHPTYIFQIPQR
jgi:hypothetical protein